MSVKITLTEALHARPANLLVRLAAQHPVTVEVRKGTCRADARKILDVLSLGAAKGDEIEILAVGEGAELALAALAELVTRNFDGDLVPETGSAAVEGIAIGRAVIVAHGEARPDRVRGSQDDEVAWLREAEVRAVAELDTLIGVLPPDERALLEPERLILAEIVAGACDRVRAGSTVEDAIAALTENAASDLLLDARARLLEALHGDARHKDALDRATAMNADVVVIVEVLTPSLVATLPPGVRGIVAAEDDPAARGGVTRTSHAAILARGRELPLAFVPPHVALAIAEGDPVVVDTTTTPARVWVAPSATFLAEAHDRRAKHVASRERISLTAHDAAAALGIELLVNVGSLHDRVPSGASGVGLLRTELLFADRRAAPGEGEQVSALLAVSQAAAGRPVTVRLFDAGGDKPLGWLACPSGKTPDDVRGVELLLANPAVLAAQCAAIARAAQRGAFRALIPMVRSAADVLAVRALLPASRAGVALGAMIETPDAARAAGAIADVSDFLSIGTNDLAAAVLGTRGDATRALDPRVLAHVASIVTAAHARGKRVTVCGEVAADPRGARILVGLGVDGLSVSPPRLADAVLALQGASRGDCQAAARAALSPSS